MEISGITAGVSAIAIAYLLGSIPGAYLITRLLTGKDIRKLGGNAGARNVYRQVGLKAAILTAIIDVGKGAAAMAMADLALKAPQPFLALAGLAAVAGHMWSIYMKFTGGNGLSAAIGVLSLTLTRELVVVLGMMLILTVVTRNPILSLSIGLLSLPLTGWFFERQWLAVIFSVLLIVMMAVHFFPTAREAVTRAGSKRKLISELLRLDEDEKKQRRARKGKLPAN
ncbi:MAG: glycerol-3-phosphate acyltransferase [Chloroflexi bacterium]|nr:glycerol-3-phosphate acyltransferase [Chloroflexota bacterium]